VLFKAGDPQALADKVLALLGSPDSWPALRARGRRFVEEQRNWAASVSRYRAIYAALAQRDLQG
jgi:glycosyltransferase involved in cell wall biosynthesis